MAEQDQREKAWWGSWWKHDFSWEGQDESFRRYWAAEQNRLIKGPNGKHYTRFHLPFHWDNGLATEKASWTEEKHQALAQALEHMLENHRGEDNPAPFSGVVLKRVPRMLAVDDNHPKAASVNFHRAWLHPGTTWASQMFAEASFQQASFSGDAHFGRAQFSGDTDFWDAQFSGNAYFGRAQFPAHPDQHSGAFQGAVFNRSANFIGAGFRAFGAFDDAVFLRGVRFSPEVLHKIEIVDNALRRVRDAKRLHEAIEHEKKTRPEERAGSLRRNWRINKHAAEGQLGYGSSLPPPICAAAASRPAPFIRVMTTCAQQCPASSCVNSRKTTKKRGNRTSLHWRAVRGH
ncbi:MAG: pentapeptide repeat-containing protein [Pseudomonadota bacterium]